MSGYNFSAPSPYSDVSIPGTVYLPDNAGRFSVCYICPDMASVRSGPYGLFADISGSLAKEGFMTVLFDTAGNGDRAGEEATFLDQDTYDLDRIRGYIRAAFDGKIKGESLIGYGAGALTAVSYAPFKTFEKLVLISPMLTWKNELDVIHRGKMSNPDCPAKRGHAKCRKGADYVEELEFRSTPSWDGMNAALHQLAAGFSNEIRVLCGTDKSGTSEMLRAFAPYYSRRHGEMDVKFIPGIEKRNVFAVPELKMRLSEAVTEAVLNSIREHDRIEDREAYAR